jgi:hypothetical protein
MADRVNTLAPGSSTLHEGVIALEPAPSEVSSVERERDLRLDFFRGIALFSIFLDHLPGNVLAQFTIQSFMFGDAAEVFILISGYTAGMVYGRCLERPGFLIAAVRVGHRLWLFLSKGDLGLLGFANVLAVAALVRRLISPQASFLAGPVAWPAVACGRDSLHIFCVGILLTVLGHLVLREFFGGFLMQLAVSVVGMAIMVAVAALMDWFATRAGTGGRVLRHAPTTSGRS